MSTKKTLVIGASEKPERYSNIAVNHLLEKGYEVVAIGARAGKIKDVIIETGFPVFTDIYTVTLYLSVKNQKQFYDYIINLKPHRIIFNPGAENAELFKIAEENNIEAIEACTLVMLSTGEF